MKKIYPIILVVLLLLNLSCNHQKQNEEKIKIRGWNILTDHTPTAIKTIKASKNYKVNQLQLSHEICHNLKDVKNQWNRNIVNKLTKKAHQAGIPEVVVWDHALYKLDYYPDRFKLKKSGLLDLDNPKFWKWFKADYRKMLDLIPEVNGIVLTFIETGARVENQHSEILKTPQEKLAALVDSVATVIVNERNLKLYIRSFMDNRAELNNLMQCFKLIKCPDIVVMAKETPHDFFITHPISWWIQDIPFPVIIEFDCTHEFNGQGIVASIFPEIHLKRWKYYQKLPNVIGFSIRTDRFGNTSILGRPSEINLFAVHEATKNPEIKIEDLIERFIAEKYDSAAITYLKPVFEMAPEIILSSFYTLGLNTTKHSSLDFDYRSIYTRHVSGRWMDNPEIFIGHGVNKKFHYWIDIVNHLAPAKLKRAEGANLKGLAEVFENQWIQPEELMDITFLNYVITEKEYGIQLAKDAITEINKAKLFISDSKKFNIIYHTFNRTLMSAKLRKAYAQVYYSRRIWERGEDFQNEKLLALIQQGVEEIRLVSEEMKNYRQKGPVGQYNWVNDADIALKLVSEVEKSNILN
ncbi:MAG: hypothetical protein L3J11_02865 [Draconibacterium sp.]|nr:hypothetical protein [Draconibacterium sp.]